MKKPKTKKTKPRNAPKRPKANPKKHASHAKTHHAKHAHKPNPHPKEGHKKHHPKKRNPGTASSPTMGLGKVIGYIGLSVLTGGVVMLGAAVIKRGDPGLGALALLGTTVGLGVATVGKKPALGTAIGAGSLAAALPVPVRLVLAQIYPPEKTTGRLIEGFRQIVAPSPKQLGAVDQSADLGAVGVDNINGLVPVYMRGTPWG